MQKTHPYNIASLKEASYAKPDVSGLFFKVLVSLKRSYFLQAEAGRPQDEENYGRWKDGMYAIGH